MDDYQDEGRRHTRWLAEDVIKYHRTVATCVNTLIDAGFRLTHLSEPGPAREDIAERPDWRDERRRPMFLLLAAVKGSTP